MKFSCVNVKTNFRRQFLITAERIAALYFSPYIRRVMVHCRSLYVVQLFHAIDTPFFPVIVVWTPCWQLPCNLQLEGPSFTACKCLWAPLKVTVWNTIWNWVIMTAPSCKAVTSWYSIITTVLSRRLGNATRAWNPNYLHLNIFSKYKKAKSQYVLCLCIDYFRGKWASNFNMRKMQFPNIIPITLLYRLETRCQKKSYLRFSSWPEGNPESVLIFTSWPDHAFWAFLYTVYIYSFLRLHAVF